jgi:hypothetical protein
MKLSREKIRNGVMMAALVFLFAGIGAITSKAQEEGRTPPSESPKSETPSAPAESPRSDPAPSSPSSSSPSSSSPSSSNDNSSSNSSRGSDSGNYGGSNNDSGGSSRSRGDEGRKAPKVDGDGRVRRSSDRSNSRERVPVDKMPVTTTGGSGGSDSGRGRDRDRDRDRDRWRGRRGHDRDRHRHRLDDCYQVPAYDNTVIYQPATYPTNPADSRTAYERGYDDGVFTGANDGRRKQTYDPERSHFYKDAPGYRPVLGSRDVYKQAYRDGFLRGYREGFQNWQKYFVGGEFRR